MLRLLGFRPKDKKMEQQGPQQGPQQLQQGAMMPGAAPMMQQQSMPVTAGRPAAKPRGLPGLPGAAPPRTAVAGGGDQWNSLWKDR